MLLFYLLLLSATTTYAFQLNMAPQAPVTKLRAVQRRAVLKSFGSASFAASAAFLTPNPAIARSMQGQFNNDLAKAGIVGDVSSSAVQSAVKDITILVGGLGSIKKSLQTPGNENADVGAVVKKNFKANEIRARLNVINNIFDEETQIGTDRTIRIIVQDLNELNAVTSPGKSGERSARRLDELVKKITKLENELSLFLSYVS